MATDYVVRLTGQDNLSGTIKKVKQSLTEVGGSTDKLDLITQKFQKIESSTAPLKKKIRDLKNLMAQMNLDGLSNTDIFSKMAQQAGTYADAIADASTATTAFANDNFKLQAMAQGLEGLAAAGSIAAGAMGLLGSENKEVTQAILKVQSALSILNGVQAVANILNKDSALMLRLKQIRTLASTAATSSHTTALGANTAATVLNSSMTKKDTVVQNAWNMAKAIAKALLGDWTGLVLVGAGALATYAIATSDSTDKLEEQAKATDKAKELQDNYNKSVASNAANLVSKFKLLQNQWSELRTEADKTDWIKNNATEFSNLGISINDVKTAEDIFVNNTDNVVKALEARAKALAAEEGMTNAYKKYYDRMQEIDNTVEGGGRYNTVKKGSEITADEFEYLKGELNRRGVSDYNHYEYYDRQKSGYKDKYVVEGKGVDIINAKRNQEALERGKANRSAAQQELDKEIDFFADQIKQGNDKFKNVLGTAANPSSSSNKNNPKSNPNKPDKPKSQLELNREELSKVQKDVKDAISDFNSGLIDKEKLEEALKKANDYFESHNIKAFIEIEYTEDDNGFEKAAEKKQKEDKKEVKWDDEYKEGSLAYVQQQLSEKQAAIKLEIVGTEEYNQLAQEIAYLTDQEHIIQLQIDNDGIKSQVEQLEAYKARMGEISDAVGTIGNSFASLGNAVGGTAGQVMEFAGMTAQAVAQMIPQIVALIGVQEGEALAAGTASAAAMPFPANIAAIASIVATITALFASFAGSFAEGGIIGGGSLHGDRLLARVNSGEMILNSRQQASLFNALDSGINNSAAPTLEFKLKGSDICGAIRNYNSKMDKLK